LRLRVSFRMNGSENDPISAPCCNVINSAVGATRCGSRFFLAGAIRLATGFLRLEAEVPLALS
jgi:hypothetical protein